MEGEVGAGLRLVITLIMIAVVFALMFVVFIFGKNNANEMTSNIDTAVATADDAEVRSLSNYSESLPVSTIYATLIQHCDEIGEVKGKLYSFYLEKENASDTAMEVKMISEYSVTKDSGGTILRTKFLASDNGMTPISMDNPVVSIDSNDPIRDALEQTKESFMGRAKVDITVNDSNLYVVTLKGVTR